jgi:hypothetical protein
MIRPSVGLVVWALASVVLRHGVSIISCLSVVVVKWVTNWLRGSGGEVWVVHRLDVDWNLVL